MKQGWFWIGIVALALVGSACGHSHSESYEGAKSRHAYKPGDGAIDLKDNNEVVIRAGGTRSDARVGADGSLRIGDEPVEINAEGRGALKAYDAEAVAIEQHAVALGVAGAQFGIDTAASVLKGLFNGTAEQAGKHAEEGADELVASVKQLCGRLSTMYDAQQTAADEIPQFKPYAVISQRQVRKCYEEEMHHHNGDDDDDDGDAPEKSA